MKCGNCKTCEKNVGWIGLWTTIGLGSFKLYIGLLSGSRALVASAFCSLTDVAGAFSIITSTGFSQKPISSKYPYGYGKVEFIVTMIVSLFILLGTILLFISSFIFILQKVHIAPGWVAFFAALLSSALSWIKYKFANCVALESGSPAIHAHAEHNKIDSITAIFVAVGVLFGRFGLGFLDPLIAIFEAGHVLFASGEIFNKGIRGLMDASVSHDKLLKIENASLTVEGVKNVSQIRARQTGRDIFVDVAIKLQRDTSVAHASLIKKKIKESIVDFVPQTRDVFVRLQA